VKSSRARVVIADDHPVMRAGVRGTLEVAGYDVSAEAATADGAVAAAIEAQPDLCLLDIQMPGSGIEAARRITARLPRTAVVMLTVSRDDDDLFAALKAGAIGYLLKDMAADRLPAALEAVLRGEAALPRGLVARLVDEFNDRSHRRVRRPAAAGVQLTGREWDVLEAMRSGLTTRRIAERLSIDPATVRTHIHNILHKLQATDREDALRLIRATEPDPETPSGKPEP
jgi:DNA-binding NarL/FixJ family response regulator